MSMNWIVFFVSLWVIGSILGATMSGGNPFGTPNSATINSLGSPTPNAPGFLLTVWKAFTMDYEFFNHPQELQIIRWICMVPLLAAVGYATAVFLVGLFKGAT